MGSKIYLAETNDLSEGTMKNFKLNGQDILVALINGNYYATDSYCPHMGGALFHGKLEGTIVTCPRHGSQFDLRNGHVVRWLKGTGLITSIGKVLKPPRKLTTYPIKLENGKIFIEQ